jgi:hypothetical protein
MPLKGGLLRFMTFPLRVYVYAEDNPPRSGPKHVPSSGKLKPGVTPISQKEYFIPHRARVKIQKHFDRLLKYGIL